MNQDASVSRLPLFPTSRRRRVLVALAALALLFVALHTLLALIAGSRLERTVDRLEQNWGPMTPASLAPPDVPDADNRAKLLRAAAETLDFGAREERRVLADFIAAAGRLPEGRAAVEEILERNEIALELMQRSLARPSSNWGINYRRGMEADVPPLLPLINLMRINAADGLRDLRAGDLAGARDAVERGLGLSDSLREEPILIVQLVRLSLERQAVEVLREILADTDPPDDWLARTGGALGQLEHPNGMQLGLLGEMKAIYHTQRLLFVAPHDDRGWVLELLPLHWLMGPWLDENLRAYLEWTDVVVRHQEVPRFQRSGDDPSTPDFGTVHGLAKILAPDLGGAVDRGDVHRARVAMARTALALRRHRLAHGAYPETLQELVPEFLDTEPIDPFTGATFDYRSDGKAFELTSAAQGAVEDKGPIDPVLRWQIRR